MNITFSPVRRDDRLVLSKSGEALTVNGTDLDFGPLPAGALLPRDAIGCDWIAGDVERDAAGALTVPLILPHGPDAPEAARFPASLRDVADGAVTLPGEED